MKYIILSAEEAIIEAAHSRARAEQTTLNEQFRRWLADYAQRRDRLLRYDEVMKGIRGRMKVGKRMVSREAMNER